MKKTSAPALLILLAASFAQLSSGCKKESVEKLTPASGERSSSGVPVSASGVTDKAIDPSGFLGNYSVRNEKTVFMGQANPKGTNVLIRLSYLDVEKTITATTDKKHLTMPYGPSNYVDSGWAYIIDYNAATKSILLSPNKAMQQDIVAGSFKTLSAQYDPKRKEGSFTTRFTAIRDNGNESQVSESFWKE